MIIAPEVMLIGCLEDGNVVEVNKRLCSLSGYSRDEFIGKKYLELDIWADADDKKQCWQMFSLNGELIDYKANIKVKGGKIISFLISVHKFHLAGQECFVSTARELSKQYELEEALIKSESLYREAQELAHIGHWELDLLNDRLLWSDEIFRIFEVDKQKNGPSYDIFLAIIHPEDREAVDTVFQESVKGEKRYEISHRLKMQDGRIKYVHERGRTEYDNEGLPVRSIGTVQDITSLKKAEMEKEKVIQQLRQSQKLEAIGTLAGGIAHDFNNILFAILGYAAIALEFTDRKSKAKKHLERIIEAGLRAKSLVSQILTFCRKTNDEKKPVMIRLVISEALKLARASLPATIKITKHLNSDSLIMAETTQIYQVIINLCTNAGHAMQKRGGVLTITLEDVDIDSEYADRFINMQAGKYLQLTIADNGHGMDAKTRDCIFDPFFTTKSNGKGTGLGLSVVHGIVKSHGGQIMVCSEPDIGTSFILFFPVTGSECVSISEIDMPLPRGNESVLVVDDEEVLAKLVMTMLDSLGYRVKEVSSPAEALDIFKNDSMAFDLVISDMNMPDMSGVRLTAAIRKIRKDIPVILFTGFSEENFEKTLGPNWFQAIMIKPVMKKDLAMTIRQVLDSVPSI